MRKLNPACWIMISIMIIPALAFGVGDLSKQEPVVVKITLGSEKGNLSFSPSKLTFETGKLYKLVLTNPSLHKHYFTSLGFAAAVWTRKVQDGSMEVKGSIREIEMLPGGTAEWFFVPVQTGVFELYCHVKGHREAGMVGTINIK